MLNTHGSSRLTPSAPVPPRHCCLSTRSLPALPRQHTSYLSFYQTDFKLHPIYQNNFESYSPKGLQSSLLDTTHNFFPSGLYSGGHFQENFTGTEQQSQA